MIDTIKLIMFGIGSGILVAAPVGPVNIICIQRAIERGFWAGLAAGIGATIADGLIALAAASGIAAISGVIADYRQPLQFFGGIILIAFGAKLIVTPPATDLNGSNAVEEPSAFHQHVMTVPKTFFLTITNPGAVLGMFALVASTGTALGGLETYAEALLLVCCVMLGSLLWWAFLSRLISRLRHRLSDTALLIINEAAGALLIVFGLILITRAAIGVSSGA